MHSQLQDFGASLLEFWNLMDTPVEEQQLFQHVTCHIASTEDEVSTPGILSMETIAQVLIPDSYFDLNVQGLF